MLPALFFLVLDGILPYLAFKNLRPEAGFAVLAIAIFVSIYCLGSASLLAFNLLCKRILFRFLKYEYNRSSGKTIAEKKEEIFEKQSDRYLKFHFFYVFLCFVACTFFALAIYNNILTITEFVKMFFMPFALFDGIHFLLEIIDKENVLDALIGLFITSSFAMLIGGGILLFSVLIYVLIQVSVFIVLVILSLYVFLLYILSCIFGG